MIRYTEEQNIAWRNSLPKKRIAVKVLARDDSGKVLLVKPNYREYWQIPGGGVDEGESPLSAAIREFREEVGLSIDADELKLVELFYGSKYDDLVAIYELTKVIDPSDIIIQESELDEFKIVNPDEVGGYLSERMGLWWGGYRKTQAIFEA